MSGRAAVNPIESSCLQVVQGPNGGVFTLLFLSIHLT